jgi:hypothetical protein
MPISRHGGWSNTGNLTTGNLNKQVNLAADFSEFDPTGTIYTVQVGLMPPTGKVPQAEATVEWSVAGGTIYRKIAVVNGAMISAPAQGVKVSVRDVSVAEAGGIDYSVTIQVSRRVRPNWGFPPILRGTPGIALVGAGGNTVVMIPENSGVNSVQVTASAIPAALLTDADLLVEQLHGATQLKAYNPRVYSGFVPMAPEADRVKVTNQTAGNLFFNVTFGVDG